MSEQILEQLIKKISKLPGLGPRSSRRAVLHLLKDREKLFLPLIQDMTEVADKIKKCIECGNLDQKDICGICSNSSRNNSLVCVVETVADLWALERSNVYNGKYHILGGVLSEIVKVEELTPDEDSVRERINEIASTYEQPKEVVDYYYSQQQLLSSVEAVVLEDQVTELVLSKAKVADEECSYEDAVKPDPEPGA